MKESATRFHRSKERSRINWALFDHGARRVLDACISDYEKGTIASAMLVTSSEKGALETLVSSYVNCLVVHFAPEQESRLLRKIEQAYDDLGSVDLAIVENVFEHLGDFDRLFEAIAKSNPYELVVSFSPGACDSEERAWEGVTKFFNAAARAGYLLTKSEEPNSCENDSTGLVCKFELASPSALARFELCTGCATCAAVCPANALEMRFDEDGFKKPELEGSRCTNCSLCVQRCPSLNPRFNNKIEVATYALQAEDDVRSCSSSGGAFTLLARHILQSEVGGYVCGAFFNKDALRVEHAIVSSMDDIAPLRQSKYVQSDIEGILPKIRTILEEENRPVLFVGCPCQIAALDSFLGKSYEQLYTIDFLCGGVPSPKVFEKYLRETCNLKAIENVTCRPKAFGWDSFWMEITNKDGSVEYRNIKDDPYEQMFHSLMSGRKSCFTCVFSTFPRQGDMTIGDYWGVQNFDPDLDDGKGTSLVAANNQKGELLLSAISEYANRVCEVPREYASTNRVSPKLARRVRVPQVRDRFFALNKTHSFQDAIQKSLGEKYDIAVVSNWGGYNYGAQLTQYAFYSVLTGLGYDVLMVERPKMDFFGGNCATPLLFAENPYPSYALCDRYDSLKDMRDINRYADTFIVPSDQLWNSLFAEKDLFSLGYVNNDKKKLSYATSFGHYPHNWSKEDRAREAFFLKQFDAISVREQSGVKILEESFGLQSVQVLDPVFLAGEEVLSRLADKSRYGSESAFVCSFVLDPVSQKQAIVEAVCGYAKLGTKAITDVAYDEQKADGWSLPFLPNVSIEDLLACIRQSSFVVTDSYHGACFAIIFNKPFIVIANDKRGRARFVSLLEQFGLQSRLVDATSDVSSSVASLFDLDYAEINVKLEAEVDRSMAWLTKQLSKTDEKDLTAFDICAIDIDANRKRIDENIARTNALESRLNSSDEQIWKAHEIANNAHARINSSDEQIWKAHEIANDAHARLDGCERAEAEYSEKIAALEKKTQKLDTQLENMKKSKSYRIGRAITYIPRKIKKLLKKPKSFERR